ncbi:MAG: STAS/SEC14 domain-containing protein [Bacteroidetes bacterium]|jgi:hypothetical protein|uniref:STAS/SEC14 domain-containing protein n=1 Tax=uncultured Dysgonomonas sp. TaxID=206096 RepID=UPI001AD17806|nr:STAS/SEC14 domain-containing protein [uncultured Dysgonomonas sp.]MBN9484580.1 STAS/SEC14 domain-containing protein [Bacteroidota bacterium]
MIDIGIEGNIIYTVAMQILTKEDYEFLIPRLENLVDEHKKVKWYFEMQDFKGWEISAFWQDVKFDTKYASDFEKIAMVGEKKWQEWMTDVMKVFTSATIKHFDLEQKDEALSWIKQLNS